MLSRAQNTFHHNPRLRGPVSSAIVNEQSDHMCGSRNFCQRVPNLITFFLSY